MRRLALPLSVLALFVAGCGGEEEVAPTAETVVGTIPTETMPAGNAEKGKEIFTSAGCGSCHTFEAAGTSATVGPNLDESLQGKDSEYIREGIVNPDAEVAEGFSAGVMPKNYGEQFDDQELADLVAFLSQS
jgi:mono/diheme cytochrome c family protein